MCPPKALMVATCGQQNCFVVVNMVYQALISIKLWPLIMVNECWEIDLVYYTVNMDTHKQEIFSSLPPLSLSPRDLPWVAENVGYRPFMFCVCVWEREKDREWMEFPNLTMTDSSASFKELGQLLKTKRVSIYKNTLAPSLGQGFKSTILSVIFRVQV